MCGFDDLDPRPPCNRFVDERVVEVVSEGPMRRWVVHPSNCETCGALFIRPLDPDRYTEMVGHIADAFDAEAVEEP
jgi:hypothetical protein